MKNQLLLDQKAEVDGLFSKLTLMQKNMDNDEEVVALLTYHLVIRVSGFVENCVRIIFTSFASLNTQAQAATYIHNKLAKFPNPTFENIVSLAQEFDKKWASNFKTRIREQGIPLTSLESINKNRNAIAHGGTSTITLRELENYYNDVLRLIGQLEDCCQ